MNRVHLIQIEHDSTGIKFEASEEAGALTDLMKTPYNESLRACARWLTEKNASRLRGEFEQNFFRFILTGSDDSAIVEVPNGEL